MAGLFNGKEQTDEEREAASRCYQAMCAAYSDTHAPHLFTEEQVDAMRIHGPQPRYPKPRR